MNELEIPTRPPSSSLHHHHHHHHHYHQDMDNWFLGAINRSLTNQCSNTTLPSGNLMTSYHIRQRIILDIYVVSILCLVGFVGNALTIIVLSRNKGKTTSTDWLLQTLAVVDTIYLVCCLFVQTLKAVNDLTNWLPGLSPHFPYVEKYVWPVTSIAQTMTIWTVLLVTVDRYVAVCKPFSAHLRSLSRVKILVVVMVIAAIVFNIPQFLEREIFHGMQPCGGKVTVKIRMTSLRHSNVYYVSYKIVCYLIFRSVGPLVTLLVLNILLIQALRRNRMKHRILTVASPAVAVTSSSSSASSHRSKNRENITLMLIVVVSVFIVCQLPDVCLRLAINHALFIPTLDTSFYRYVNAVTNVMLTLNSSVNFLIYCLVGRKFRRIFFQTFLRVCCAAKASSVSEVSESQPHVASTPTFRELAIVSEAHQAARSMKSDVTEVVET